MLLTPLVIVIKSTSYFLEGKHNQQQMQQAFSLYLPGDVVRSMTNNHDINSMNQFGELMQGVCMATDAGQYTTLSESMNPQHLNDLMNNYYGVMFPLVKMQKGIISDVTGDAMFAIWSRAEQTQLDRKNACKAALKISQAVDQFNRSQPHQLPTRIGMHFGDMRLGNVGALDHFEYRAVGDTVNTAARIEGLNKLLGTKILISANVINDLTGFFTREMGYFILRGKTHPIHIYELIAEATEQRNLYCSQGMTEFLKALKLFQQQQWSQALAIWQTIERDYPGDGPTLFYLHYLKQTLHLAEQHVPSQATVIKIGNITIPLDFNEVMRLE
jgi:adenylate cyclase